MAGIDSHQHFWNFDPVIHSWINDEMSVIQRDFLPADIQPLLQKNNFEGSVLVQVNQSEKENDFFLQLASENDFIKGVVGWIDLLADNAGKRLEYYSTVKKMKGFRHILQGEPDEQFMLREKFKKGISLLNKYNFTYDVLVFPNHLKYAKQLINEFPEQKFVIDHLAKPYIKDKQIGEWKNGIEAIAEHENVYCKISGMVTEADWKHWERKDFIPYIDAVVESFGTGRIMFGSDWPVCLVAASYAEVLGIVQDYFSSFSKGEQENFFRNNAIKFYNLV